MFPHPDDESYGPAGTLARNAARTDTAVAVYIMTRGEASSIGAQRDLSPDQVAALRRDRLEQVDEILGLDALLLGRFPDGGMARSRLQEMADAVGAAIDAMQPQVIIGHDPRGVNAHLDHVAAHWAIRSALVTRPGIRFAMVAYPQELVDAVHPRLMFATPEHEVDCRIDLTPSELTAKQAALNVHEAIVTMVDDGGDRLFRPPLERFDFLGEDFDLPLDDLFGS